MLRIEGNLQPFMANLQYIKDVVTAPRALLTEIEENEAEWTQLLEQLRAGAFVDIQRLFRGQDAETGD